MNNNLIINEFDINRFKDIYINSWKKNLNIKNAESFEIISCDDKIKNNIPKSDSNLFTCKCNNNILNNINNNEFYKNKKKRTESNESIISNNCVKVSKQKKSKDLYRKNTIQKKEDNLDPIKLNLDKKFSANQEKREKRENIINEENNENNNNINEEGDYTNNIKSNNSPYFFSNKNIKVSDNSSKDINFTNDVQKKEISYNITNKNTSLDLSKNQKIKNIDNKTIIYIIIDDNLYIRNSQKNLLDIYFKNWKKNNSSSKYNFEIIDGADGIDLLKFVIEPNYSSRIRGVFIDENMEFMNGSEAVRIIRKFQNFNKIPKFKIATVTAFEDSITKNNILQAGVDEIYPKPFKRDYLIDFFNKYPIN